MQNLGWKAAILENLVATLKIWASIMSSVGSLQLSVGKLQLPVIVPRAFYFLTTDYNVITHGRTEWLIITTKFAQEALNLFINYHHPFTKADEWSYWYKSHNISSPFKYLLALLKCCMRLSEVFLHSFALCSFTSVVRQNGSKISGADI